MSKNKLYASKEVCPRCQRNFVYNQTHHWLFCGCVAPHKYEMTQHELETDWVEIPKSRNKEAFTNYGKTGEKKE